MSVIEPVLPDQFRNAMRDLPGAVCLITVENDGERSGFTASSVVSLSLTPPTIMLCVNKTSQSVEFLKKATLFGVQFLSEGQEAIADRFAGRLGVHGDERFQGLKWDYLSENGPPLLAEARICLECRMEEMMERHSHFVVFGQVMAVREQEDNVSTAGPLVYWQGHYRKLAN